MKPRKFRISVEDESKLENLIHFNLSSVAAFGIIFFILIFFMFLGALTIGLSPIKKILPGYLSESERLYVEEQYLRLDSLVDVHAANTAYLRNIMAIMGTSGSPQEPVTGNYREITPLEQNDTLLPTSEEEKDFINSLRESEKYHAFVVAPAAAEGIYFAPLNEEAVISHDSEKSVKADIIVARGAYVGAIADGTVIAVEDSMDKNNKSSIIILHPKGFVSRYSNLETPLVKAGDNVAAGEAICDIPKGADKKNAIISLEMWHNGTRLIPGEFLSRNKNNDSPVVDKDVGRGRL